MYLTVNTDASYHKETWIWTYAYWIKWENLFYKWSWVFKEKVSSSTEAETRAIMVAVWLLQRSNFKFKKIIFNRDNINAHHLKTKRGNTSINKVRWDLRQMLKDLYKINGVGHRTHNSHYEYRHVRAHTNKDDSRSYVNDWCDRQCKKQLSLALNPQKKNEKQDSAHTPKKNNMSSKAKAHRRNSKWG